MTFVLDMHVPWVSNHAILGACAGDSGWRGGMIKSIADRALGSSDDLDSPSGRMDFPLDFGSVTRTRRQPGYTLLFAESIELAKEAL